MLNFLNAISIFGYQLDWDASSAMFWLLVIQGVLILIEIAVFCTLILRANRKNKNQSDDESQPVQPAAQPAEPHVVVIQQPKAEESPREMTGLTLDLGVVQREFEVGSEFNCDGLIIHAEYNIAPTSESVTNIVVVDEEPAPDVQGCFVVRPDMSVAGKPNVSVRYNGQVTIYPISVVEPEPEIVPEQETEPEPVVEEPVAAAVAEEQTPAEEPQVREAQIIAEESAPAGTLRYDKSFQARLIQSDDDVKRWYTDIKNELLSFKKVHDRYSWKRETFKSGKIVVAKLAFRGKTMCLYLPLNPADYVDTKYQLENVSNTPSNVDTPAMYRIKNDKRVKYALELIDAAMEKLELPRVEHVSEDFYMPYEGIVELIKKGLVKRDIKTAEEESIFNQGKTSAADDNASSEPQEIAPGIFVTTKKED